MLKGSAPLVPGSGSYRSLGAGALSLRLAKAPAHTTQQHTTTPHSLSIVCRQLNPPLALSLVSALHDYSNSALGGSIQLSPSVVRIALLLYLLVDGHTGLYRLNPRETP